ncbi:hypothetical protein [Streptomyces sp. PSAA01]|uniref:hypothetical protein n=1 Tax=Streptomyces sp. PSAA01 TaxID=2912762 RepID=UPI001F16B2E5|nr:hypothetical protein [Streptomyces sp. PSAA01]MCG0286238.1 hypothetical protein [Streptomyces sp. PSAA01]
MGDARTADPCKLLNAASLSRFGETVIDPDYGEIDRRDVLLHGERGDDIADVQLNFDADPPEPGGNVPTRRKPRPQPLTWKQTAARLAELRPGEGWREKRVEHLVNRVRMMLSRDGVPWLTREEVGEPVDNALNDHLIRALMMSTTLVPPDLALIDAA